MLTPVESELLVATCAPDGRPAFANPAWKSVFGEAFAGRLAEDDRALLHQYIAEAARGSLVTNEIFLVNTAERDEPLPVLLHFVPVLLPGDDGAAVQAVTITGEVLAEPDSWTLNQTQRHRMETLGRMTMGIAHDFNNLLSGILGYTELLKTLALGEVPEATLREHLGTIEQAALDGAALVRKIQQYLRQEKQTHFELLDLPSLIQDCLSLTRPYWYNEPRRQGIAISTDLQLAAVPPIRGNGAELREVFINLLLNAVQAMPAGGTLTCRTWLDPALGVRAQVADTGTGMSEPVVERIFEPLFTTKGERGNGMGLAVSYGIVQEHDGTIAVDSALGQGTTFTLTFPPARETAPAPAEPAAEPGTRTARILVVDDEPMVRAVLVRLLTLKGHAVEQAGSGPEALALHDVDAFDLVFTDHGMPEMNGRELARALHARRPGLPIILLTGDTEVAEAGRDVSLVMSKPFQLEQLEAAIQRLL